MESHRILCMYCARIIRSIYTDSRDFPHSRDAAKFSKETLKFEELQHLWTRAPEWSCEYFVGLLQPSLAVTEVQALNASVGLALLSWLLQFSFVWQETAEMLGEN